MNLLNATDLFPTRFFHFKIDQVDAFNLLNEIKRKEEDIRLISSVREHQSLDEYATDYPQQRGDCVVELEHLNKIFCNIKDQFDKNNSTIDIKLYWTAIYLKNGYHQLHNHKDNILDNCNYSGIIYLSDLGGTTFYSVSPTSFESRFFLKSEMGKIIIFPSLLPHAVEPTHNEENKRYVVAFNCEIRNK